MSLLGSDWTELRKAENPDRNSYFGHKACLGNYYQLSRSLSLHYGTRSPPISLLVTPKINLIFVACRALITVDHQDQLYPQEGLTFAGLPEAKSHILRLQPSSAALAMTNMQTKNANNTMMTGKVS